MASKADFTEEEWKTMQKGVTGVGLFVSASDRDFTDTFGEVGALARYMAEQHEQGESQLVRELAEVRKSGFGLTSSSEKVEAETLASLRSSLATLTAKAPDELDAYRQLVLGVADHVANAKGGLGPTESAAIDKVKEALGSS
jgi:hypothetical protein